MIDDIVLNGERNEAIVLIHGLGGTPAELDYLAHELHHRGYTVYVPFFAQFGYQDSYSILKKTTYTTWQKKVIDRLKKIAKSHDTIHLGGLCIGATIACSAFLKAKAEIPQIKSLLLLSPFLALDGWRVAGAEKWMPIIPLTYFYCFCVKEIYPYGVKDYPLRQSIINSRQSSQTSVSAGEDTPLWGLHESWKMAKDLKQKLADIHCPLLIIHSKEDDLCSYSNAELIFDEVSSFYKFLMPLEDCFHMITIDREREKVARLVSTFVDYISA